MGGDRGVGGVTDALDLPRIFVGSKRGQKRPNILEIHAYRKCVGTVQPIQWRGRVRRFAIGGNIGVNGDAPRWQQTDKLRPQIVEDLDSVKPCSLARVRTVSAELRA